MPGKKEFNKELKRLTILNAAKKLFIEKKYNTITVDEIAKIAGITKRTLYLYYPSKLALFIHVQPVESPPAGASFCCFIGILKGDRFGEKVAKSISEPLQNGLNVASLFSPALADVDDFGFVHLLLLLDGLGDRHEDISPEKPSPRRLR